MAPQQNDPDGSDFSPAPLGEKQVDKVVVSGDVAAEKGVLEAFIKVATEYKNLDLYLKVASKKMLATIYIASGAVVTGVDIEGSDKRGLEALAEILALREGVYFLHRLQNPADAARTDFSIEVEGILAELTELLVKSTGGKPTQVAENSGTEESAFDPLAELDQKYEAPKVSSSDVEEYTRPYSYIMMTHTDIQLKDLQTAAGWIDLLKKQPGKPGEESGLLSRLREANDTKQNIEEPEPEPERQERPAEQVVAADQDVETKPGILDEGFETEGDKDEPPASPGEVTTAAEVYAFRLPSIKLSRQFTMIAGAGALGGLVIGLLAFVLLRPDSYVVHLEQGDALMREGKFNLARDEFSLAEREDPKRPLAYISLARSYGMEGKWQEAQENYSKYLAIKPDDAVGFYERANSLLQQNKFSAAIKDAEKSIALNKQIAEPYLVKARALGGLGKYTQSVRVCDRILALPIATLQESEAYAIRGDAFMKQRNFPQAIADFSKAIQVRPDREELLVFRAECFGKQGMSERALEDFNNALQMSDQDAGIYLKRGQFFLAGKKYNQAIDDFTEALNEDSSLQKAYLGRGRAYKALSRYSLARADLQKAYQLKNGIGVAETAQGSGEVKEKAQKEKAQKKKEPDGRDREMLPAISRKNSGDLLATGKIQLDSGDLASAIRTLGQVVRADPGNSKSRRYLAAAYRRQGNQRQAQIQLEALESMGAASPVDRLDLARLWIAAGKRQKAVDLARKGMRDARSERVSSQFRALLDSLGEN